MALYEDFKILIVDDELPYQEVFKIILEDKGYYSQTASSGKEALEKLKHENFNLVLTDLIMDGMGGLELLENVKKQFQDTEVIIVTGYGTIENAVSAIKKGAFSYFIKSHDPEELVMEIDKLQRFYQLKTDNKILRHEQNKDDYLLKTENAKFKNILDIINKAANSNVSIFITGESGVGKEVIARHIHQLSKRRECHFVAVNCQALSENLMESELFGHEKGSFTGASDRRIGKFQEAAGGTLFLDEIGEIPVSVQTKLLRVLETKTIERIGSNKPINIDLRLISATNRDIHKAIQEGLFRKDLFYRINTIIVEIPPLRDRNEDIPALINFFFKNCEKEQKKKIIHIDDKVTEFLLSYRYPGNVRELKNIIERLVVLSENGMVSFRDLPEYNPSNYDKKIDTTHKLDTIKPLREYKKSFEADYLKEVLNKCSGNLTEAARLLGISRRQLFNKVIEYNLKH